jgi:hypothetical protein
VTGISELERGDTALEDRDPALGFERYSAETAIPSASQQNPTAAS